MKIAIPLTLIEVGAAAVLIVTLDPLVGAGMIMLIAGTNLLAYYLDKGCETCYYYRKQKEREHANCKTSS